MADPTPTARRALTHARHRVRQFLRGASARIGERERSAAAELLGPRLYPLFQQMRRNDQRHGLDVMATLRQLGEQDLVVLQSALLHDAGKVTAPFTIAERSAAVLLEALSPRFFAGLRRRLPLLQHRYGRYRDHAGLGAALILRAGGDRRLAQVIAEHHREDGTLAETRRLRHADRMN